MDLEESYNFYFDNSYSYKVNYFCENSQNFGCFNNESPNFFDSEEFYNLGLSSKMTEAFNINNNDNIKEIKQKETISKFIPNLSTNFATNKTNKILIFNIIKEKKKTQLGRKRKHNNAGRHNKFSQDNIARKIKAKLFEYILLLLKSSIKKEIHENEQNEFINTKFLLKIAQSVIKDINTNNIKMLLKTKLKDIFYLNNVSSKYINYGLDYNKKIIENIYKYNTQKKTISILEKTYFECLEHFRGSKFYKELEGLEKDYINAINEFKNKGESEKYFNDFKYILNRFEKYLEEKIPRKSRKE